MMGKRKENFIKKWGMTPSEFRKRKKQHDEMLAKIEHKARLEYSIKARARRSADDWECSGGDENEIDEDSHCDMVTENY